MSFIYKREKHCRIEAMRHFMISTTCSPSRSRQHTWMKKLAYHDFDLVFLINIDAGRLLVVEGGGGIHNKGKKR